MTVNGSALALPGPAINKEEMQAMLEIGMKHRVETVVRAENTAAKAGSGNLMVFGTPYMVALMENAALSLMASTLPEGKGTVGTSIQITHSAPTPVGMKVWAEAEVTHISANGKMVDFQVRAYDEAGLIGEGTHQRAIIDNERFLAKANGKLAK